MDRNLALECVRVTEAAALSAAKWVGKGNDEEADRAAVNAMRLSLADLRIRANERYCARRTMTNSPRILSARSRVKHSSAVPR